MRGIVRAEHFFQPRLVGHRIEQHIDLAAKREQRTHPVIDEVGIGDISANAGRVEVAGEGGKAHSKHRNRSDKGDKRNRQGYLEVSRTFALHCYGSRNR